MNLTMARLSASMPEHPKYRSLNPKASPQDLHAVEQTSAQDLLLAFNQTPKSGDPQVDRRIASIKSNCKPFRQCSQSMMPTSYINKKLKLDGMQVRRSHTRMCRSRTLTRWRRAQIIDLNESTIKAKVYSLCKHKDVMLAPPSGLCKKQTHYGKYDGDKLVSLLSLKTLKLNKTPGSVLVSIDIAASIDTHHSMSIAFASIAKQLRKRKHMCVILAQVESCALSQPFLTTARPYSKCVRA